MKLRKALLTVSSLSLLAACGADSDNILSSNQLSSAISLVSEGLEATGSGLRTSSYLNKFAVTPMNNSLCDQYGMPTANESQAIYPFAHTYCALNIKAGDTVVGGFDLAESLICGLEKGGIEFNGASQSITIDFTDTECWPDGGPGETGNSTVITAVGSSPASFNTYFTKGVSFTVADFGLTFKIAANIEVDNIEFIAYEEWSDGNKGVMAGSLNLATGNLRFEKRDERIRLSCTESSCGWNRHTRIAASLEMANGEPQGVASLSYGYSDIQDNAPVYGGKLITAKGVLTSGIQARLFTPSGAGSAAEMKDVSKWTETSGTGCVTNLGFDDSADCAGNTGINKFSTNTKFALYSTPAQLGPETWLQTYSGFNFSEVDIDVDQAF